MSLENAPLVFAPLLIQIAISYTLAKSHAKAPQIAFAATLACVNLPSVLGILYFRATGSEHGLFVEMWLICALILQLLFYYKVECGDSLTNVHYAAAFLVFMNEFTFTLGGWFGHSLLTIAACFLVVKILATTVLVEYPQWDAPVWKYIIISENLCLSMATLVYIWSATVMWPVPVALVLIPYAFPLENAKLASIDPQLGWGSVAPKVYVTEVGEDE